MKHIKLIIINPGNPIQYLCGYNGGTEWEWTENKSQAWRFGSAAIEKRLKQVNETFPAAKSERI